MRKTHLTILAFNGLAVVGIYLFFVLYAHFALDYSLENLKVALEVSQQKNPSSLNQKVLGSTLKSMVVEEISRPRGDWETAALLEDAASSLQTPEDPLASYRAEVFLAELLKDKMKKRPPLLRATDTAHALLRNLAAKFPKRGTPQKKAPPPETATPPQGDIARVLLSEAERKEEEGKLEEAERYYQEFLTRFSHRPEQGVVQIALAQLWIQMRRFEEAERKLKEIQRRFSGLSEEILAGSLLERLEGIRGRWGRLEVLEELIGNEPSLLFSEEGGLELALSYLATYQWERADSVLEKLLEAEDPRLRTKALFYRAWLRDKESLAPLIESL